MKKCVYVFGNEDVDIDNLVYSFLDNLISDFPELVFKKVKPNEDLPFHDEDDVTLFDSIQGIDEIRVFTEVDLPKLQLSPRTSVHDFDLGFQLKYLMKIGKLRKVTLIGIPMSKKITYTQIHEIFKKLVAHDIQGS